MTAKTSSHPPRGDFALNTRLMRITVMAAVIGAISTVAARVLLDLIRFFTNLFFFQTFSLTERSPATNTLGAWVIVVPVIGGLIVGLVARYGSDKIRGHGIPEAIEAILFGKSKMSPKVALLKPLSSGIVIGSGGPFGAEGPIIMTGGAIGSLIAQHFHLTAAERKALLVAGATAGMTAVFGTPVAAVLLAVELLLFELRPRSLLPVAVACAVAGFARPLLMDPGPLFPLQTAVPGPLAMLSCVIAGVLCGALSASLSISLYKVEDWFGKLPLHWMWWPAIGGLAVGIGGYLQPRALGVGYDVIGDLLHNHLALGVVLALLAVKAVIWVIALGSGTSGGVLAPLLMMGAGLGVVLSHVLPGNDPMLWPLVCMAATLGGVMRAPLTATIFAFGLTHDSNALLPLLTTSAVAYRAHHAPLDPHREDRAPRLSHLPRVRHRSAGAAFRGRGDDARGPQHRCGHAGGAGAVRAFWRRAGASRVPGAAKRRGDRRGRSRDAGRARHARPDCHRGRRLCRRPAVLRAAGRELPRRCHAARAPPARTAAGGEGRAIARAGRHRGAQRSHQALARALRRRRKTRADARAAVASLSSCRPSGDLWGTAPR
jgi:H+/Cl- antiporter ClcA